MLELESSFARLQFAQQISLKNVSKGMRLERPEKLKLKKVGGQSSKGSFNCKAL